MTSSRIADPGLPLLLHQLAAAERRGLPLREVADIHEQAQHAQTGRSTQLDLVLTGLAAGRPPSAVLQQLAFPDGTVQWVALAEQQGSLAATLDSLADDLALQQRSVSTLRVALVWPACVALVILVLFALLSIFVLPALADVYDGVGAELPALTRLLVGFSHWTSAWWWAWALPVVVLIALVVTGRVPPRWLGWCRAAAGRLGFVRRLRVATFVSRLLGLLQRHHADRPLLAAAFGHLAATTNGPELARCALQLHAAPAGAGALSQQLAEQPMLPPRIALFLRLGEKLGDPSGPLAQLREDAEQEQSLALARFERGTVLLLYLLLGLAVGLMVMAAYLPIFRIGNLM